MALVADFSLPQAVEPSASENGCIALSGQRRGLTIPISAVPLQPRIGRP